MRDNVTGGDHGYGIMQLIESTDGRLSLGAGTLYGALNNLVKKDWITPFLSQSKDTKLEYNKRIGAITMNKHIYCILMVLLLTCLLVTGCSSMGSFSMKNSTESSTNNSWVTSYDKFNGYQERTIKLDTEQSHNCSIKIVTNSGKLSLSITDADGVECYREDDLQTSSFEVQLKDSDKFTIRLDAKNHSGSFNIVWE